jgi:predicted metal-binding membrane protein
MADHAGTASATGPVQALPPRQLAAPWIAVAALATVAWGVTVMLAQSMGNGPGTMGLALLPFLGLWVVMMAAMMLPSVAPVAVGVMNIVVMAALAVVIFAEKLWRYGKPFGRAVGALLVATGVLAIWLPWLLPGLHVSGMPAM